MRVGICCSVDSARGFADAGFDYVELPAAQLLGREAEVEGLPIEATNVFFPGSIKLFGADRTPYLDHARHVISLAAELGAKLMVLGSGASRRSNGTPIEEADTGFVDLAAELNEIAKAHGLTIAPESLGLEETDVGNDLGKLAPALKAKGVGFTADSYHILWEWRRKNPGIETPPDDLWSNQIPFAPSHVHFATLPRIMPKPGDPLTAGFFARLRELGYDGRISFEGDSSGAAPRELLKMARLLV